MKRAIGALLGLAILLLGGYLLVYREGGTRQTNDEPPGAQSTSPKSPPRRAAAAPVDAGEFEDDPAGPLRLEGQVVDERGAGVKGAEVALGANPPRRVTAGERGWFSFDGLVSRTY